MSTDGALLAFVPGFMVSPRAYSSLLDPIERPSRSVLVAEPHGSFLARLAGRVGVADDAARFADLVRARADGGERVWIAGHSRGGGVAWLAARRLEAQGAAPAGVVLLDPVWGDGGPRATPPPPPSGPILIVGFGVGGRCAPEGRNHATFAAAAPGAEHVIVDGCGHGDILDESRARPAKVLCGGGPDRDAARAAVTRLVADFLDLSDDS